MMFNVLCGNIYPYAHVTFFIGLTSRHSLSNRQRLPSGKQLDFKLLLYIRSKYCLENSRRTRAVDKPNDMPSATRVLRPEVELHKTVRSISRSARPKLSARVFLRKIPISPSVPAERNFPTWEHGREQKLRLTASDQLLPTYIAPVCIGKMSTYHQLFTSAKVTSPMLVRDGNVVRELRSTFRCGRPPTSPTRNDRRCTLL